MWMQNIRWPNQDRKVGFATYVEFKDNVTAHWFDWLDQNELNSLTCWCKVCDILTSNRAARTLGCNITKKVAISPKDSNITKRRLQHNSCELVLDFYLCQKTRETWLYLSFTTILWIPMQFIQNQMSVKDFSSLTRENTK